MKKLLLALLSTTISFFAISSASAQSPLALYWDPGATGGAALGGSGTWDTNAADPNTAVWFNGAADADIIWNNADNDNAYFTGTAGTVTLTNGISAGAIYFTNVTGNYYITNATGAEVLSIANTIDTGTNEETIAAPIANSTTLNINGTGLLDLPVDNSANLSGNVMINGGEVSIENNYSLGTGNAIVASGAALEFNGGTNNGLNEVENNITISGSGITNGGAIRNVSGLNAYYGQITLGANNSEIYVTNNTAFIYWGSDNSTPLTDNGNGYNLLIGGPGGNVQFADYGINIGGSLIVESGAACYMYVSGSASISYVSSIVSSNATLFVQADNGMGTQPASTMNTNVILDGGELIGYGTWYTYYKRGITVTTNGGTIADTDTSSGADWYTPSVISTNGGTVSFDSSGGTMRIAGTTNSPNLNLGMEPLIVNGGNIATSYISSSLTPIFSNLVENACTFTFNYGFTSGEGNDLGSVPNSFSVSNIWCNGGQLHVGHSTTILATRGIYVTSAGVLFDEVTSGGTVTMDSTISGPGSVTFDANNFILATNNTYTGNTTIDSSTVVKVGNAGAYGTLGTGNTTDNGTLDFDRTGSYSYGGVISGSGHVNNIASGVVTLTGKNTYTGNTTNSAGTLLINNTSGSGTGTGSVLVSGGALGGSGIISGPVTVASGGKLSLGLSTLTIDNNLTLSGSVSVFVNKSLSPSSGEAVVTGTFTDGTGTITVTNLGPSLAVGDKFTLFSEPASSGGTMTVTGGGTGVTWNNNLAVDGSISVASIPVVKPVMNQLQVSNGSLIFGVTNVSSGTYYELSSTNIELPLSQWTPVSTNTISGSSEFFITNPIIPGNPQQYFILQVQ